MEYQCIAESNGEKLLFSDNQVKDIKEMLVFIKGKKILYTIKSNYNKRYLTQNSYLHKLCGLLSEALGEAPYYYKEFNKHVFIPQLKGIEVVENAIDDPLDSSKKIIYRTMIINGEEMEFSSAKLPAHLFYEWVDLFIEYWNTLFNEMDIKFYLMTPDDYYRSLTI